MRTPLQSSIAIALLTLSVSVFAADPPVDMDSLNCRIANKRRPRIRAEFRPLDQVPFVLATLPFSPTLTICKPVPPPGDPTLNIPFCTKGTGGTGAKCDFYCTQDATRTATGCEKYVPAQEPGVTKEFQSVCDASSPGTHIAARPTGGCTCGVVEFIKTDGHEDCVLAAPANSKPTCLYNDEKIGPARCDASISALQFECNPGFKLDKNACVVGTPDPTPDPTPKPVDPTPAPSDDFVKDCAPDFSFSFASPTEVCKCYRKASLAKSGSQCGPPPSGHGKGGCKNVETKASKCGIICDAPAYKLSDDGLDCVLAMKDVEMKEDDCADAEGGGQYMSAVPGQGCVCLDTPGPYWCKPATPDIGTPMCSDKTTAAKGRVIECLITDCPVGYTAKAAKCEANEGAFGTISSVTKCKTPSTIYALPGTAGCSCVAAGAAVPSGGKLCAVPANGYSSCSYLNKTPRVPASCGTNCNPGSVS
ncbi:hypothetical protein B0H17DRAFT_1142752 [Mycena rosella]|uniref:Uncharacterized protein n=1 Tax=Mycena rosella TaxID=1033263 RepID=A0AAD7CX04_MYCRO|nr:hypothetical protein B0H17DRAFT_1142752 [Mycena rosella]